MKQLDHLYDDRRSHDNRTYILLIIADQVYKKEGGKTNNNDS